MTIGNMGDIFAEEEEKALAAHRAERAAIEADPVLKAKELAEIEARRARHQHDIPDVDEEEEEEDEEE